MSLPVLPDVIGFGPLAFPTGPLATVAGTVVVYVLAVKLAERADARAGSAGPAAPAPSPATVPHSPQAPSPVADPALVDRLFTRVAIGLLLGAKAADILGSPLSFIHNPRLLIAWPGGPTAAIGAVIGALLLAGPLARRGREIPAVLDVVATPLLLGLGVVALGLRDARALPLAAGLVLAAAVLAGLRPLASFPGHTALGGVVLASLVAVGADFFRPAAVLFGGISRFQVMAAVAGLLAYGAAVAIERARGRVGRGEPQGPVVKES